MSLIKVIFKGTNVISLDISCNESGGTMEYEGDLGHDRRNRVGQVGPGAEYAEEEGTLNVLGVEHGEQVLVWYVAKRAEEEVVLQGGDVAAEIEFGGGMSEFWRRATPTPESSSTCTWAGSAGRRCRRRSRVRRVHGRVRRIPGRVLRGDNIAAVGFSEYSEILDGDYMFKEVFEVIGNRVGLY